MQVAELCRIHTPVIIHLWAIVLRFSPLARQSVTVVAGHRRESQDSAAPKGDAVVTLLCPVTIKNTTIMRDDVTHAASAYT